MFNLFNTLTSQPALLFIMFIIAGLWHLLNMPDTEAFNLGLDSEELSAGNELQLTSELTNSYLPEWFGSTLFVPKKLRSIESLLSIDPRYFILTPANLVILENLVSRIEKLLPRTISPTSRLQNILQKLNVIALAHPRLMDEVGVGGYAYGLNGPATGEIALNAFALQEMSDTQLISVLRNELTDIYTADHLLSVNKELFAKKVEQAEEQLIQGMYKLLNLLSEENGGKSLSKEENIYVQRGLSVLHNCKPYKHIKFLKKSVIKKLRSSEGYEGRRIKVISHRKNSQENITILQMRHGVNYKILRQQSYEGDLVKIVMEPLLSYRTPYEQAKNFIEYFLKDMELRFTYLKYQDKKLEALAGEKLSYLMMLPAKVLEFFAPNMCTILTEMDDVQESYCQTPGI